MKKLDITHRHVPVAPVNTAVFIGLTLLFSLSAYPALAVSTENNDTKFVEIFKDDFEDGNTVGWKFYAAGGKEKDWSSTWKVESEGSNRVLSGEEHTLAQIKSLELTDFSLETKFKFIRDVDERGFHLTVRNSENGRYFIGFGINTVILSKTERRLLNERHFDLYKTYAQFNTNTWYTAKILIVGNNIKIYVNDLLKIDYVDVDNPLYSGLINFETLENSHIHFDDVRVMAQNTRTKIDPSLVAEYHFDGDAKDSSGNRNDGVIYGATFVDGISSKALSFDGTDDYVSMGSIGALSALTVEGWAYYNTAKIDLSVFGSTASGEGRHISLRSNGFELQPKGVAWANRCWIDTVVLQTANAWHYLVLTWDGTTAKGYLDNTLIGSCSVSGTLDPSATNAIGRHGTDWYMNGIIDEVRIYNRALSDAEIKAIYNSIPSGSSGDSQLWNSKGIAFSEAGRVQEALNAFDKAIELDPNNANAWENKGYALQNLRRYQEAIDAFDKALELNPDNLGLLVDKTWSLNSLGKRQEAIAVAQEVINKSDKLIAVNPDNDIAWQTKGRGLVFLGKYAEAIIAFDRAISINSINPHNWFNKGEALFTSGKYQEAVDAYDKALSINPNLAYFWRSKGDALKALGKYQEANEAYDKAIEVTTGSSSGVASGTDNLFLARIIAILVFFILIISTVFSQKENNRINLPSYAIAGLSVYSILELLTGLFQGELFILVGGLGAAVFGILSRDRKTTVSLAVRGFVSFLLGFAQFMFIVRGDPNSAGFIALPALFVWGCIHGIGVGSIYKNFRMISVVAGVSAFGLLFGALSEGRFADYFGLPSDPPFGYGIFGGVLGAAIGIGMYYASVHKPEMHPKPEMKPEFIQKLSSEEQILAPDIKRGYAVLPNNDIKFGIRITNNTGYTITDVDTILDYTEELFKLKKSKLQRIGNIPPETARTAPYILKPLGCIHNESINAIISYTDATGKKHALHMRPKEVHCVCPFLKEKPLSEGEYSRLAANSEFVQEGISFKGISVEELSKFMGETCRHMLYKVREYDLEGKKVIYLSGESLGEKAYYLLTAVIQEYKGLTQVILRAHSDKKYGLNGFMNEMADNIRHLVGSVQSAKEIGIIENTQVINIIDSVVQRTSFNMDEGGKAQVNIRESMMQRSNIGASARKCPNCGREVEANEKFCLECGARL